MTRRYIRIDIIASRRMIVAFTFVGDLCTELAQAMLGSVRRSIPGAYCVQLTDHKTPLVEGADGAIRLDHNPDLIEFRCRQLRELTGEVIYLDYDCIVQKDISSVFEQPFDIALTRRPVDDKTASPPVRDIIPYNFGVSFQRNGKFWSLLSEEYAALVNKDGWMMGQYAGGLCVAKSRGTINVLDLPGEYYNYTPTRKDEDVTGRAVVHYKGKRKHWMLRGASPEIIERAMGDERRVAKMTQNILSMLDAEGRAFHNK